MNLTLNYFTNTSNHTKIKFYSCLFCYFFFISVILVISGCSGSRKFTSVDDEYKIERKDKPVTDKSSDINTEIISPETIEIRVLLSESFTKNISINSSVNLYSDDIKIALINKGNTASFSLNNNKIELSISGKTFLANQFTITSDESDKIIRIDGRSYRGKIKLVRNYDNINLINQISLEDYVKGVMTREMPLGRDLENYEALKAFSICVRTYAYTKLFANNNFYDILPDTRDQVYGGVDSETEYSNKIVDETKDQILTFDNKPAIIFYYSTCGGYTEDVSNVFSKVDVPYLKSIKDGTPSHCSISPRYEWTEIIPDYKIINRLAAAKYISGTNFSIKKININSRFESGRVNELEFILNSDNGNETSVKLYGNNIRSVIRTADDSSILRSNFFNISRESNGIVIINGRGNGHGVGLCQWGAIGLSRNGVDYKQILQHYYPGTEIQKIK